MPQWKPVPKNIKKNEMNSLLPDSGDGKCLSSWKFISETPEEPTLTIFFILENWKTKIRAPPAGFPGEATEQARVLFWHQKGRYEMLKVSGIVCHVTVCCMVLATTCALKIVLNFSWTVWYCNSLANGPRTGRQGLQQTQDRDLAEGESERSYLSDSAQGMHLFCIQVGFGGVWVFVCFWSVVCFFFFCHCVFYNYSWKTSKTV